MKRQKRQGKKLFFIFRLAILCSYYSPSKLCLSDELKNTELEKDNNRNDMRMKLVHISSSNLEFEPVRFISGRFFLFLSKFSHLINHLNYSTSPQQSSDSTWTCHITFSFETIPLLASNKPSWRKFIIYDFFLLSALQTAYGNGNISETHTYTCTLLLLFFLALDNCVYRTLQWVLPIKSEQLM